MAINIFHTPLEIKQGKIYYSVKNRFGINLSYLSVIRSLTKDNLDSDIYKAKKNQT